MDASSQVAEEEERLPHHQPFYNPFNIWTKPILVDAITLLLPLPAPLLIHNEASEIRDFCANERTFLSYLRLSIYLAVVAVAIILSFHFQAPPTVTEKKVALPLGIVFWLLAVGTFVGGVWRYVGVVEGYGRRRAVVQSGWVTQALFVVLTVVIVGTCIFFISIGAEGS